MVSFSYIDSQFIFDLLWVFKYREIVKSGGKRILRKLKAAAKFATKRKILKGDDSIYDTKQSSASLQAKKDQSDLDEFDKLLNDDSNTFQ